MNKEYQKKYRAENRERLNALSNSWYHKNKEKNTVLFKLRYKKYKDKVYSHYGEKCVCCGESKREFLCIDHIKNDGAEHRRSIGKKSSIYIWLIKNNFPEGFQILCFNCNNAKQYYGQCPHQSIYS